MAKIKVSEATGRVLDWMVAQCEGDDYTPISGVNGIGQEFQATAYSTDWSQGGPIIDRLAKKGLNIKQWPDDDEMQVHVQYGYDSFRGKWAHWANAEEGILTAAMRCYVASKLGDEVEVPDELVKEN